MATLLWALLKSFHRIQLPWANTSNLDRSSYGDIREFVIARPYVNFSRPTPICSSLGLARSFVYPCATYDNFEKSGGPNKDPE